MNENPISPYCSRVRSFIASRPAKLPVSCPALWPVAASAPTSAIRRYRFLHGGRLAASGTASTTPSRSGRSRARRSATRSSLACRDSSGACPCKSSGYCGRRSAGHLYRLPRGDARKMAGKSVCLSAMSDVETQNIWKGRFLVAIVAAAPAWLWAAVQLYGWATTFNGPRVEGTVVLGSNRLPNAAGAIKVQYPHADAKGAPQKDSEQESFFMEDYSWARITLKNTGDFDAKRVRVRLEGRTGVVAIKDDTGGASQERTFNTEIDLGTLRSEQQVEATVWTISQLYQDIVVLYEGGRVELEVPRDFRPTPAWKIVAIFIATIGAVALVAHELETRQKMQSRIKQLESESRESEPKQPAVAESPESLRSPSPSPPARE